MQTDHNQLLASVAQDYYLSKMSIRDITQKYNLSRYLIVKYLDEAFEKGIVSINVHSDFDRNASLERVLKHHFNIKNLAIIKDPSNPLERDKIVSSFAASQIQSLISNCHVVGLTWGETIYTILDHFNKKSASDLTFTQFMGENMKYHSSAASMRMVQKAAAKYDVPYQTIPGPLYVVNDQAREALYHEPAFTQAFADANKMDMIICGLGTLQSIDSIPAWQEHTAEIFPGVDTDKIAGMAFGRPYDIDGNFLVSKENDKTLSIPLETIKQVPRRIAIVQRKSKYQAALGALHGELFTDMILTESVALRITEEKDI
ncbi:MAG: sugar-binding domain-containing protein [Limosilactobacillus sp.]|uniref:sugar-binding transcriptional regulator n=1 Tax=Limosilactobacillus sp. TaxID=2773925 RepID=UPI0027050F48|nr:sugar-binding domain-containing protein [Limosilactobacillus sp.]